MSLLQQIRDDLDDARKRKDQFELTILTTLYSEAMMVGKTQRNGESTDKEVTAVIRKFKFGVEEIEKYKGSTIESCHEIRLYEKYLPPAPVMLPTDQLIEIIQDIIEELPERNLKQMGVVMGKLKAGFLDRYDGEFASKKVRELLS